MFEVPSGSDKISLVSHQFVRSPLRFGQNHAGAATICPKSPQVRTKSRRCINNLSEVTPGSDKIMPEQLQFVRSPPRFGQNLAGAATICLKSPQVRTKSCRSSYNLSEVTTSSDKIMPEHHQFVRSPLRFGQNLVGASGICPKSPQVRTKSR